MPNLITYQSYGSLIQISVHSYKRFLQFLGALREAVTKDSFSHNRFTTTEFANKIWAHFGTYENGKSLNYLIFLKTEIKFAFAEKVSKRKSWVNLGSSVSHLFKRSPSLSYVYGTIGTEEERRVQRQSTPRKIKCKLNNSFKYSAMRFYKSDWFWRF